MNAPRLVLVAAAAVLGLLGSTCGESDTLRPALEAYQDAVGPQMDKEREVNRRLAALLDGGRDQAYFDYLRREGQPFYEAFRVKVRAIDPGHPEIAVAQGHLGKFADARLEFANASLQTQDLPKHLRNVERIRLAEADGNMANRAYLDKLGNEPQDPAFSEMVRLVADFQTDYMRAFGAGEIDKQAVLDRLRLHVLERLEELRARKAGDDELARLLRAALLASEKYHQTLEAEMPSVEAAFTSRRRTQQAVDRAEENLRAFLEELKRLRRMPR